MIKKVVLGISGGVDSAVAAVLLKKRGFNVEGVFMKNWDIADERGSCKADEDYKDAAYLCSILNIRLHHLNFVKEYWNEVFCNLLQEYQNGCTPNPDILCNRNVKFNYFYKFAFSQIKSDAIATGHYARSNYGPYLEDYDATKPVKLLRAKDVRKDQTFFLSQVKQEALKKTMFPIGELMKWQVKQIAVENGLQKFALKHESMGICFIGTRNFPDFIAGYIPDNVGQLVDIETGKVVGNHSGLHKWTLGQRSKLPGLSKAFFISRKNVQNNVIYVAQGTDHSSLYSSVFPTTQAHWIHQEPKELQNSEILHCEFKFQNTQEWVSCQVCKSDQGLVVRLDKPKRALTPGQYAVFYRDDECLGSAKILNSGITNFSMEYLKNNLLNSAEDMNKLVHIESKKQPAKTKL